jgi:hypothetical protein
MALISDKLNKILSAVFGKDVRQALHDGLDAINRESENTTARQKVLEETFDHLTINAGNSNAEIVAARVKNDGTSFDTIGKRLNDFDEHLDNKASKNVKVIRLIDIGCNETNSAEENSTLLISEMNKFTNFPLIILVDDGYSFEFGELNINRSDVIIQGGGTLENTKIKLVNTETQQNIKINNIKFYFDTLQENNNAITMQKLIRSEICNCKFYNCDKAITYTNLDEAQHVSRIKITNNYFHNMMYAIYGVRGDIEQPLIVADIHIINNIMEYCLNTHIWVEGFDGGLISDNTMFFPSYMLNPKCMTKQYNIYIDYCNWTVIKGNNLFESGKDSILLNHSQCVNVSGNNIAWCGQINPSYAITFINGDNGKENGIYNMSTVVSNIISKPSGGGLYIDEHCGYISANSNIFQGTGNREFYYGNEYSPTNVSIFSRGHHCNITNNNTDGLVDCSASVENKSYYSDNIEINTTNRKTFNTVTYSGISMDTLDATNVDGFVLNLTGSTITNIDGGYDGKEIMLHFYSPYVTIDSSNILLKERTSKLFEANTTLVLKYFNSKWHEVGRDL